MHRPAGVLAVVLVIALAAGSLPGGAAQAKPADSVASNALDVYSIADWTAVDSSVVTAVVVTTVGSCSCDLTEGSCDGNCCCDTDCSVRLPLPFSLPSRRAPRGPASFFSGADIRPSASSPHEELRCAASRRPFLLPRRAHTSGSNSAS